MQVSSILVSAKLEICKSLRVDVLLLFKQRKKKKNIKISNVYRNNAVHVLSNVDKLHATNMRMLNNLNKTEII